MLLKLFQQLTRNGLKAHPLLKRLKEAIKDGLTGVIKGELGQGNFTTVEVTTQFSDVYEVDEET